MLAVPGDQTALIQVVPADQVVKNEGTAYIECSYQQADVLEWFFKDKPLQTNEKYVFFDICTYILFDAYFKF